MSTSGLRTDLLKESSIGFLLGFKSVCAKRPALFQLPSWVNPPLVVPNWLKASAEESVPERFIDWLVEIVIVYLPYVPTLIFSRDDVWIAQGLKVWTQECLNQVPCQCLSRNLSPRQTHHIVIATPWCAENESAINAGRGHPALIGRNTCSDPLSQ